MMDRTRVHRIASRPYHRSMPISNTRQTIEDRLQGRGISTSSNSSWTFSNSHSESTKRKHGRLCGVFLVGAVFIVIIAVLAIGGLAFYMGALRVETGKQDLVFDGSLRITYGDQYQNILSNHSSKYYQDKVSRYEHMLTSVYQRSIIKPALQGVTVLKFENGSLIVNFRIILDRRKIPNTVSAVEDTLLNILTEEISSVKPIAFRNIQVDRQSLRFKRILEDDDHSSSESMEFGEPKKTMEIKNGVVRKIGTTTTTQESLKETERKMIKPKNSTFVEKLNIPGGAILGISEKMQNFTESLKTKVVIKEPFTSTTTPSTTTLLISSSSSSSLSAEAAAATAPAAPTTTSQIKTTSTTQKHPDTIKSVDFNEDIIFNSTSKVYQSVYVTSDHMKITNDSNPQPKPDKVIEGSFKVTKTEADLVETQGKTENYLSKATKAPRPQENDSKQTNGHARPHDVHLKPEVPTSTTPVPVLSSSLAIEFPSPEYVDEPWKPIIPGQSEAPPEFRDSYVDVYDSIISSDRLDTAVQDEDIVDYEEPVKGPVTFSKETYEQNLKVVPDYDGKVKHSNIKNNKLSRITEDLVKKYKELLKNHRVELSDIEPVENTELPVQKATPSEVFLIGEPISSPTRNRLTTITAPPPPVTKNNQHVNILSSLPKQGQPLGLDQMLLGIKQIDVMKDDDPSNNNETKTTTETNTTGLVNSTVTNPFAEADDSRSSTSMFNFELPDLPILKQFHHLDSLLKSFSGDQNFKMEPEDANRFTSTETNQPYDSATRFPLRTRPTIKSNRKEDTIYIEVSTISPDSLTKQKPTMIPPTTPSTTVKTTTRKTIVSTTPKRITTTRKKTTTSSSTTTTTTSSTTTTSTPKPPTTTTATTSTKQSSSVMIQGEVEVVDGPSDTSRPESTTPETPKLITLLPVRSNVNMKRPLRPRPKSDESEIETTRQSKMGSEFRNRRSESKQKVLYSMLQQHKYVDDKDGKRWVYYSSSKLLTTPKSESSERLFIVTPEPKTTINFTNNGDFNDSVPIKSVETEMIRLPHVNAETKSRFPANLTKLPIYDTIESLLSTDYRKRPTAQVTNVEIPQDKNTSEIVDKIVKIMENVAISTGNTTKVILKVNQTLLNDTGAAINSSTGNAKTEKLETGFSTKAVSSNYILNQAGLPILTKILNKDPNFYKDGDGSANNYKHVLNEGGYSTDNECNNSSIRCGNGVCLAATSRCNQLVDCPDASDERNCTCAEHLKSQHLHRKLCDGVVDCWDFSDELDCDWCKPKEYLCTNSRMCISKTQICDGQNNCPLGDDERYCVTVSPTKTEADSFNYHNNGYLMVRKFGKWGKLCIDNFDHVSLRSRTGWKISDLGRSVCKALTFKDFDKVERTVSVPNEGRSLLANDKEEDEFYELLYNDLEDRTIEDPVLTFHKTNCTKKEVVKVTCTDLECGLRPQAVTHWSRIVGGGNANPGSWPWQAALYKEGEFQCGATLISDQWLISAGHCFYHNQDEYWVARLGTLRTSSSLPSPYEQLRQISKVILHPQYVDSGFVNDISLLRMTDSVRFTDYVRPICLPKPMTKIVDGSVCTVVGWGQLFEIGRIFPDTLQEVQLPIISSSECRKRTVFLPLYRITDDMFCAGYERGGRDACLGDSGGPLMCQESDGRWSLYGVTSNGYGCARSNRPGVYTKVSRYLNWIQSQMHLNSEDYPGSSVEVPGTNSTHYKPYRYQSKGNHSTSTEVLIKLISERLSNVKFNTDSSIKPKDRCKGHRCPLGECLPKTGLCNGYVECSDGSDEKDCW